MGYERGVVLGMRDGMADVRKKGFTVHEGGNSGEEDKVKRIVSLGLLLMANSPPCVVFLCTHTLLPPPYPSRMQASLPVSRPRPETSLVWTIRTPSESGSSPSS